MIAALWSACVGVGGRDFWKKINIDNKEVLPDYIWNCCATAYAISLRRNNKPELFKTIRTQKKKHSSPTGNFSFLSSVNCRDLLQNPKPSYPFLPLFLCGWAGKSLSDVKDFVKICSDEACLRQEDISCAELFASLVFLAKSGKSLWELWVYLEEVYPQIKEGAKPSTNIGAKVLAKAINVFVNSQSFDDAIDVALTQESLYPNLTFIVGCLAEAYYPMQIEHQDKYTDFVYQIWEIGPLLTEPRMFDMMFGPNIFERKQTFLVKNTASRQPATDAILKTSQEILEKYIDCYWEILQ